MRSEVEQETELIETLWNVNELSLLVAVLGFTELIETYWNVDYYHN